MPGALDGSIYRIRSFANPDVTYLETSKGGVISAHIKELFVPTREQLAKEIAKDKDGEPIYAWACECIHRGSEEKVYVQYSNFRTHCIRYGYESLAAGIPIVTARQVTAGAAQGGFNGTYPPKERTNAE